MSRNPRQFRFRQLRFRDAPRPPVSKRLVFSEQAQTFFEIFGDKGAVQLMKSMREFYFQARYLTPAKERKDIRGMARLAMDEAVIRPGHTPGAPKNQRLNGASGPGDSV